MEPSPPSSVLVSVSVLAAADDDVVLVRAVVPAGEKFSQKVSNATMALYTEDGALALAHGAHEEARSSISVVKEDEPAAVV